MFVLSRRTGECILIGDEIVIEVVRIVRAVPRSVGLAVSAPSSFQRLLLPEGSPVPADQQVVSRGKNESLQLSADIRVIVIEIRDDKVRIGIDNPKDIEVERRN